MIAYFRCCWRKRQILDEWRITDALRAGHRHFVYGDLDRGANLGPGRIYPALTRLLRQGAVEDGWQEGVAPPRQRRWYRLTPSGLLAVQQRHLVITATAEQIDKQGSTP